MEGAAAAISNRLIDSNAIAGPLSRCLERIEEYRQAGADLPIIVPNAVAEDYVTAVRKTIATLAKVI